MAHSKKKFGPEPSSYKGKFSLRSKNVLEESNLTIYVVIPAYNEDEIIRNVMEELRDIGLNMVVVDDGSVDGTYNIVQNFFTDSFSHGSLYRHVLNRGLGAAIKTGIEAALRENPDVIVTFDADGQHDPEDIITVCKPLIHGDADVVIGRRDYRKMPLAKKIGNQILNTITWIFYGVHVHDSQSGLRAFTKEAAKTLDISIRGYGVSSEIIKEIKRNHLKLEEVPIKTIYTDYSLTKGTNMRVGFKILVKMIMDILK